MDRATLRKMGGLGLFGIELPESVGGLGQTCLTAGLVMEALCGEDLNIGYITITASLLGQMMCQFGGPDAMAPWIKGMLAGELLPAIALTEPAAVRTRPISNFAPGGTATPTRWTAKRLPSAWRRKPTLRSFSRAPDRPRRGRAASALSWCR